MRPVEEGSQKMSPESSCHPSICHAFLWLASFSDRLSLRVVLEMAPHNLKRIGRAPCSGFSQRHQLGHLPVPEAIPINRKREHAGQARVTWPALAEAGRSHGPIPLAENEARDWQEKTDAYQLDSSTLLKTYGRQLFKNLEEKD